MIPGHFIIRGSLKSAAELYNVPLSAYQTYALNNGKSVDAYRTTAKQFGKQRTIIISLGNKLRGGQIAELNKQLNRFQESIQN